MKNQSSAGGAGQEDRGALGWQKKGKTFLNYIRDLPRLNLTIAPLSPCPAPVTWKGECNFFGAYGYNRDKKKGKKQIVIGLLV